MDVTAQNVAHISSKPVYNYRKGCNLIFLVLIVPWCVLKCSQRYCRKTNRNPPPEGARDQNLFDLHHQYFKHLSEAVTLKAVNTGLLVHKQSKSTFHPWVIWVQWITFWQAPMLCELLFGVGIPITRSLKGLPRIFLVSSTQGVVCFFSFTESFYHLSKIRQKISGGHKQ